MGQVDELLHQEKGKREGTATATATVLSYPFNYVPFFVVGYFKTKFCLPGFFTSILIIKIIRLKFPNK